jgi:hypothetical protein
MNTDKRSNPWFVMVPIASLSLEEARTLMDIQWAVNGHTGPRPGREIFSDEAARPGGVREQPGAGAGVAPVGSDTGGIAPVGSGTPVGRSPADEEDPIYGTLRTICCFATAHYLTTGPAMTTGGPSPRPGPSAPYVLIIERCPAKCFKGNGVGAQALLDNLIKCLEVMQATSLYANNIQEQKDAIECLKRAARGLPDFSG